MNIIETNLSGVVVIEPKVFGDKRGFFMETYNADRYRDAGIPGNFVQDNLSKSSRGILRGLHFQNLHGQGKLVSVVDGSVFDVAVDIRTGSPTFGEWFGTEITDLNKKQVWIPPGFAHGFCVTSETAIFSYKCTEFYTPDCEHSLLWNDPKLGIDWPIDSPLLSVKDKAGVCLKNIDANDLPVYPEQPAPSNRLSPFQFEEEVDYGGNRRRSAISCLG